MFCTHEAKRFEAFFLFIVTFFYVVIHNILNGDCHYSHYCKYNIVI